MPLLDGWKAPETVVEVRETASRKVNPPTSPVTPDSGDNDVDNPPESKPVLPETPDPDEDLDDDPDGEPKPVSRKRETPDPGDGPELEDDDPELDDEPQADPKLPPFYAHGDADPRPFKAWLINQR